MLYLTAGCDQSRGHRRHCGSWRHLSGAGDAGAEHADACAPAGNHAQGREVCCSARVLHLASGCIIILTLAGLVLLEAVGSVGNSQNVWRYNRVKQAVVQLKPLQASSLPSCNLYLQECQLVAGQCQHSIRVSPRALPERVDALRRGVFALCGTLNGMISL